MELQLIYGIVVLFGTLTIAAGPTDKIEVEKNCKASVEKIVEWMVVANATHPYKWVYQLSKSPNCVKCDLLVNETKSINRWPENCNTCVEPHKKTVANWKSCNQCRTFNTFCDTCVPHCLKMRTECIVFVCALFVAGIIAKPPETKLQVSKNCRATAESLLKWLVTSNMTGKDAWVLQMYNHLNCSKCPFFVEKEMKKWPKNCQPCIDDFWDKIKDWKSFRCEIHENLLSGNQNIMEL
nr:hypothetical transcript [Hymenolepis microstoma]